MPDAEGVVLALGTRRKRREPAVLLDGVQPVAPAGEHFVRVRLVTDVPYQAVARRVVHEVQGDGELDRTEAGGEVAAAAADALNQEVAQLLGEGGQLILAQAAQVRRRFDRREQRVVVERYAHRLSLHAHHVSAAVALAPEPERCVPDMRFNSPDR